ncbi:shikimate dehydrogenase family protein [Ferruginibacter sp.]
MKLYGVIGYPLGHSFSKKYFTEKFLNEGISDCAYEMFPLQAIEELKDLLFDHPELCGLNITIPYKQAVLQFLTDRSQLPAGLNACNCIKIAGDTITGYNTDIIGFERSLLPLLKPHHTQALVLGSGGASEAVQYVLKKLQIAYKVVSRQAGKAAGLTYADLDENTIATHTLIINTTPLGTYPNSNECPDIPYQYLGSEHYLFDLVYNPPQSLFLQKGAERGAAIKNGYEMLVIQAEESWNIWNEK